jgi:hypothetical protein
MSPSLPSFDSYVASLSQLSDPFDPTIPTAENEQIKATAARLAGLATIDQATLAAFISVHPDAVPVLGLAVGLTREKLRGILQYHFGTSGWVKLAKTRSIDLVAMLDEFHEVVRLVDEQRARVYDFGDVLVARAGTRQTATAAGRAGRRVEDLIEAVAHELGLPSQTRGRFTGRRGETAPFDVAIPAGGTAAEIVVAAKGNDSTGSKLTDAVREIEEMADKRAARQYVMAVVDGIGWKRRLNDLRRIYKLRETGSINGLYTLASLDEFRSDLQDAAHRLGLL